MCDWSKVKEGQGHKGNQKNRCGHNAGGSWKHVWESDVLHEREN